MSLRLLNAARLAQELGRNEVSHRKKGHYLFASFMIWLVISGTGLASASPLWSWMSLVETAALLLVYVLGFAYSYEAAGGDENPDFVVQFTCLYVPVSLTTSVVVWGLYWVSMVAFRESVIRISESHLQFAINLVRIGSSFMEALVFLTVIAVQAIIFFRITRLFRVVRAHSVVVDASQQVVRHSGHA